MLGSFRRFSNSKLGAIVAFVVLGLIALAFAAGDVTGLRTGTGGMTAKTVADVGNEEVTETELVSQVKNSLRNLQQDHPAATMAELIAQNGVETLLDQLIDRKAATAFAAKQGIVVSDRAVDGVIASIPAFRGPDGKFSQTAFESALAQQKLTERDVRGDIAGERIIQFLTAPANGATVIGTQYALPYASLLLERRKGAVAMLPATAVGLGAAPTDAELNAFYRANMARYTVPERRVVRYALVTPASALGAPPTDAELQAAYKADPARFAASEKRTVQVVLVLDQGTANTIVNQAKAGAGLDTAARAAGLEARTLTKLDKAAIAKQTSAAVADAIFAGGPNAVIGPVRGGGGFTVAKLTAIERVPAKSFEQARAELLPEVTKANQTARLGKLYDALDSAAGAGAGFDEMVRDQKLIAQKTAPVLQNGVDPLNPAAKPDPQLAPIVQAAFGADQGDPPQVVQVGTDNGFALVALDNVIAAAPRPLTEIRTDVARAFQLNRAMAAARQVAAGVVAKVDAGTPLSAALAATGLKLPPVKPIDVPRAALAANPQGPDPALALLFSIRPKRARMLALPDGSGWAIVAVDSIVPGDARNDARTLKAAQADLQRVAGRELIQQFGRAMRETVGVKKNPSGLARAKAELSGQNPDAQP